MDHKRVFDHEMGELKDIILKMGVMVQGLIHKSVESLKKLDKEMAEEVVKEDENVDQLELEIDEKCIQLVALRQPEASDLRFLMTGMRIANDLERIGDLAEDVAQRDDRTGRTAAPKTADRYPQDGQAGPGVGRFSARCLRQP